VKFRNRISEIALSATAFDANVRANVRAGLDRTLSGAFSPTSFAEDQAVLATFRRKNDVLDRLPIGESI
jgi:hypothetical protein